MHPQPRTCTHHPQAVPSNQPRCTYGLCNSWCRKRGVEVSCVCNCVIAIYSLSTTRNSLTHYSLMAAIVAIRPNWVFFRIGRFNTCTLTTLILKNLHHCLFRTYQVFSGPCISQCVVFNWKALMLIYISSFQLSWAWKSGYNGLKKRTA